MNWKTAIKVILNILVLIFIYLLITFKTEKFKRDQNTHVHNTHRVVSTLDSYHKLIDEKYETIHSHESNKEPIHNQYFSDKNIYEAGYEYFLEILLKLIVFIFVFMSLMTFNKQMSY
jgi:uncharacterized membrane protein